MAPQPESLNLYDVMYPGFINTLKNLKKILTVAVEYAKTNSIPESDLLTARLSPDMFPLPFQVQSVCDGAKFFGYRVGGAENMVIANEETTFEQLQARLDRTIAYIEALDRSQFDRPELYTEPVSIGGGAVVFKFDNTFHYATEYLTPNVFFHVSMAYAILRMKGVPLSKMHYLAGGLGTWAGRSGKQLEGFSA